MAFDANSLAAELETLLSGPDKLLTSTYKVTRTLNDPNIQPTSKSLASSYTITLAT